MDTLRTIEGDKKPSTWRVSNPQSMLQGMRSTAVLQPLPCLDRLFQEHSLNRSPHGPEEEARHDLGHGGAGGRVAGLGHGGRLHRVDPT